MTFGKLPGRFELDLMSASFTIFDDFFFLILLQRVYAIQKGHVHF
jgi:hypothetical protein